MKNLISVSLVAFSIVLLSCSKEAESPIKYREEALLFNSLTPIGDIIDEVGTLHNESLEFMFLTCDSVINGILIPDSNLTSDQY